MAARGRPRSAAAEESILRATLDLLAERGPDATTINAVAARSGVARATIYLRWPGRDALITAALRHAIGREPYPLTGDLAEDIRRGAEQARLAFSEPLVMSVLPVLVRGFLGGGPAEQSLSYAALAPNRQTVAASYRRSAGAQGFRTDIDGEVVVDLVIGAVINQILATGRRPSPRFTRQLVDVVLAGLREERDTTKPGPHRARLR